MDSRDCVRLAHALAKAAVQPRAGAATIEQCIYQIALLLARDNTLHFDLGAWRQLIEEHRESLELAADQASFERDCRRWRRKNRRCGKPGTKRKTRVVARE